MKTPASKEEMEAPQRICLRHVERDGHMTWMQSSGYEEGDVEYVRAEAYDAMETALDAALKVIHNLHAALALATPKEEQQ